MPVAQCIFSGGMLKSYEVYETRNGFVSRKLWGRERVEKDEDGFVKLPLHLRELFLKVFNREPETVDSPNER